MESTQILVTGIGGLGCTWASRAHQRGAGATLLMLDADDRFPDVEDGHIIRLGHTLDALGCAALPPLAEQRMRSLGSRTRPFLEQAELVIIVAGLGGGTGTGASHEFARQAKLHGATVLSIAALPFEHQPARKKIAEAEIKGLNITPMFVCNSLSNVLHAKPETVVRIGVWVLSGWKISSMA